MNHQTGKLILISGPSGTGKSTVISRLKIMGGMNIAEHIAASLTLRGWSPRRSVWS